MSGTRIWGVGVGPGREQTVVVHDAGYRRGAMKVLRRRYRRTRARPGPGARPRPRGDRGPRGARATRHRRGRRRCTTSTRWTAPAVADLAARARRRPGGRRTRGAAGRRRGRRRTRGAGSPASARRARRPRLEGSKAFAKEVMAAAGVPTAGARVCTTAEEVAAALDEFGAPYVVKDDGLAAGKGVVVTADRDGGAGPRRRRARGSWSRSTSTARRSRCSRSPTARTVVPLQPAQDFKRICDGDEGPNTGGMGAYTPLPWAPDGLVDEVLATRPAADRRRAARGAAPRSPGCCTPGWR